MVVKNVNHQQQRMDNTGRESTAQLALHIEEMDVGAERLEVEFTFGGGQQCHQKSEGAVEFGYLRGRRDMG